MIPVRSVGTSQMHKTPRWEDAGSSHRLRGDPAACTAERTLLWLSLFTSAAWPRLL